MNTPRRNLSARQIAQKTFPSVVLLITGDSEGNPESLGSGFFVQEDIIATNFHVIENAVEAYAKVIGKEQVFRISGTVGIDKQRDLVLLKVEGIKAPPLPLGIRSVVEVGDVIYAVGSPEGLEGTFSQGIVSARRGNTYLQISTGTNLALTIGSAKSLEKPPNQLKAKNHPGKPMV